MRVLFLLLLISCNHQGGSPSASSLVSTEKRMNHYKVTLLSSSAQSFTGKMCGQAFSGDEFECDASTLDLDINPSDSLAFRIIVENDGVTFIDETVSSINAQIISYKEHL